MSYQDYNLLYLPDGQVLQEFQQSWNFMNVVIGPLGSGKTICSADKVAEAICTIPPCMDGVRRSRWYAVRNTYEDLRRTTIQDWFAIMPKELGEWNASRLLHTLSFVGEDEVPVEAEVQFLAFDRPDSHKKWRGSQLTGVWFNETKELSREVITYGLSRTGRYPAKADMPIDNKTGQPVRYWYGGIGDTNSQDEDHLLSTYEDGAQDGTFDTWSVFRQPGGVLRVGKENQFQPNPQAENLNNLDPDYYKNQMQGARHDWIAANLANERVTFTEGKAVHPEYNDLIHAPRDYEINYKRGLPVYLGIDGGRTPAATMFQEVNGGYEFFDEFFAMDMGAPRFAPELSSYLRKRWKIRDRVTAYADPASSNKSESSENSFIDILNAHGIDTVAAPVANQNVLVRRNALTLPLTSMRTDGKPSVLFAPRMRMTRKGLAGKFYYRRMQVSYDDKYTDIPEKNDYSHCVESVEYGLVGCGEGTPFLTAPASNSRDLRSRLRTQYRRPPRPWNA